MSDSTFALTDVQREFRDTMRAFVDEKVAPHAAEVDRTAEYPWKSFEACKEMELPALGDPRGVRRRGGRHRDPGDRGRGAGAGLRVDVADHAHLQARHDPGHELGLRGAEARRTCRGWPRGEIQASYCLSEADAGSDVAAMRTRRCATATTTSSRGRSTGSPTPASPTSTSCSPRPTPTAAARGVTCFLVEKDWGIRIAKHEDKLGMRGSPTGEVVLDEVRVPATHRIGEEGQGFTIAMHTLDRSRPSIGAQAVGIAQGAIDYAGVVHEAAQGLRRPHRRPPGPALHAGRHGHAQRGGPRARLPGLRHGRPRPGRRAHPVRRHGQGVRLRRRHVDHGRRRAAARRLRLHQGLPGRALSSATPRSRRSTRGPTRSSGSSSPASCSSASERCSVRRHGVWRPATRPRQTSGGRC